MPSFYSNSHVLKTKTAKLNLQKKSTETVFKQENSFENCRITGKHYLTTGVLPGGGSVRITFVGIAVRLVPSIFVTI